MLRIPGWRLVLAAALILPLAAVACSSPPPEHVSVTVRPGSSAADQAVHIEVTGLRAGQQATLQVTATDGQGVPWISSATYRADADGGVDPDRAAPLSGSYQGVSGTGPIWSMHVSRPGTAEAENDGEFYWGQDGSFTFGGSFTFTVTVRVNGASVAHTSFQRQLSLLPWTFPRESLAADGFIGRFAQPSGGPRRRAAVLVLGGSEGGLPSPLLAGMLASQGYDVLNVAYFGLPGLPSTLSGIPLEYFARALRWLARQPGVDPAKMAVLGVSRGSEAAQLLGVHYPGLVHAVIASVPGDAALCSIPGCRTATWSLGGKPLPFTADLGNPAPSDTPAAVIPDQRIDGPVFLDCGEADKTWPSCPYARAILSRLDRYHDRWTHVLYAYPGAGHLVGDLIPDEPLGPFGLGEAVPSATAIQAAEPALFQHLLGFLAAFAG
jgi:dienelactone hydrolase